jgi:predicted outer membrane protein
MLAKQKFWLLALLVAGLWLYGIGMAVEPVTKRLPEVPADLVDPAFAGKVDLAAIRQAIAALDAKALMDHAEKLLLAQRELGKAHRSLDFVALVDLALRIILEERSQEALDYLTKALSRLSVKEFDEKLARARQQLQETPRRIFPGPNVPLSETTPEAIVFYNALAKQIKIVKAIGDRTALTSMRTRIQSSPELHMKQREHLLLLCDEAIASLPLNPSTATVTLSKLSAALYTQ